MKEENKNTKLKPLTQEEKEVKRVVTRKDFDNFLDKMIKKVDNKKDKNIIKDNASIVKK